MANIKSQIKRIGTSEKARQRNVAARSQARTALKKFRLAVEAGNVEEATSLANAAYALLDKLANKGVYAKNTVARKKAQVAKALNGLNK